MHESEDVTDLFGTLFKQPKHKKAELTETQKLGLKLMKISKNYNKKK